MLYAISYLFSGFNIFGSAFFTGLNNGKISAIISTLRTLVIQTLALLILPIFFGLNGIWCAITAAEFLTLIVTGSFPASGKEKVSLLSFLITNLSRKRVLHRFLFPSASIRIKTAAYRTILARLIKIGNTFRISASAIDQQPTKIPANSPKMPTARTVREFQSERSERHFQGLPRLKPHPHKAGCGLQYGCGLQNPKSPRVLQ